MLELTVKTQVAMWGLLSYTRERVDDARRSESGASVLALMIVVAIVSAAALAAAGILASKINSRANSIPD